jgi:chitodextrinase
MKVLAFDSEGNKSGFSSILNVTTPAFVSVDTSGALLSWDFKSVGGSASAAASGVMAGISASAPSGDVHLSSTFIADAYAADALCMRNANHTTLADAISANEYITFAIAPLAGNQLSISSVLIRTLSQNQSRHFTLMSSVKGFTAGTEIGTAAGGTSPTLQTVSVTGHDNLSSSTEFRIYVWGPANIWESFGLGGADNGVTANDLVINGSVKSSALPAFPTNLAATNLAETGFTLTWRAAKDAATYEVFRNGVSCGTSSSVSMDITGVTINTTYAMTVKATSGTGVVSEESTPLNVKIPDLHSPSVPMNLTVSGITDISFILHWDACSDNVAVTSYEIDMNGSTYGNTAADNLPVPFLAPNTSYSMAVRAKDAAGNVSAFSAPLAVRTLTTTGVQEQPAPSEIGRHSTPGIAVIGIADNRISVANALFGSLVSVYDLKGNLCVQNNVNSGNVQLDVTMLNKGIYLVKLRNGNSLTVATFVKK